MLKDSLVATMFRRASQHPNGLIVAHSAGDLPASSIRCLGCGLWQPMIAAPNRTAILTDTNWFFNALTTNLALFFVWYSKSLIRVTSTKRVMIPCSLQSHPGASW